MTLFDYAIVVALFLVLLTVARRTQRHAGSVSGFLAANRCAGRYLISVAFNMAQLGVITLMWYFQQNYEIGFCSIWWGLMEGPALIVLALTGFVIYRFRATRALTLAQFFELRYSRRFRIFAGLVAFLSGMLNYGIFPGVAARYFQSLCGLPSEFSALGMTWSTFPVLMALFLGIAIGFVFLGGQIAVMVTDFLQGVFANLVFLVVIGFLLFTIPWEHVADTLLGRVHEGAFVAADAADPLAGRSPVHPFRMGEEENFGWGYWVIQVVILVYGWRAWQGDQGYNAAARSPHEARMANILNGWRFRVLMLIVVVLPIAIRTMMHHPAYADSAAEIHATLAAIPPEEAAARSEMRTPLATAALLPVGLLGLWCAAMFGAFLSTNDTYLHSWAAILVQDVIMPFRRRPLSTRAHLWVIKGAVVGIAVFAFFFSLFYEPSEFLAMFLAVTGAIFVGGAGAAIIGGLYWKRATVQGAWAGMIVGMTAALGRIVIQHQSADPDHAIEGWLQGLLDTPLAILARIGLYVRHELTGQEMAFVAIASAAVSYVVVSLYTSRAPFDMDRLLNRGAYADPADTTERDLEAERGKTWLERLGFDREFTGTDRWVTLITIAWPLVWTVIFLLGFLPVFREASEESWLRWWHGWTWFVFGTGALIIVWFTIGGFRDLRELFRRLDRYHSDARDDGSVPPIRTTGENPS